MSRELEVEGSIRKGDVQMELGAASLSLLLHRPSDWARATADRLEAAQSRSAATPAEQRADVLLLRSDIAVANGEVRRARESIEAARALVGESELTALRLRRIEAVEHDVAARNAKGVEGVRQAFESLLEAAASGNRALVEVREAACNDWLGRVADTGARRHLQLALQAARRTNYGRYSEGSSGAYRSASSEPPRPPSPGSRYDGVYGSGTFEERMARYRERLERHEKEQSAIRERENQRASEASATKQASLDQAKEALSAGLAALSAAPVPFADSGPAAKVIVPGRSFEE